MFGADGGFERFSQTGTSHVSSQTVGCTRNIVTTVVQTPSGPVEKTEEVLEGGPECQVMTDLTKGGASAFFPSLRQTGGTKGGIMGDSKSTFVNLFNTESLDLGPFMTGNVDDDVPDLQARSMDTVRVERKADFVGKGTQTSETE